MKPFAVIISILTTYQFDVARDIFSDMLEPVFRDRSLEERQDLMRFLNEGFAFNNVMRWQPHKDWSVDEVKQFLSLYEEKLQRDNPLGYVMVEEFFKQLGVETAKMLKEVPTKHDWPFWFLSMYLRPVWPVTT